MLMAGVGRQVQRGGQRTVDQKWTLLLTRLLRHGLGGKWLPGLPIEAK